MTEPRKAREYLRVSLDRSGRERSQDEQHAENAAAVKALGWTLGTAYRESGSASRYAGKARGVFDRLMRDLETGRFNADALVLWESSRGSRDVGEWVKLIEACERRNVSIYVTTHRREYHPDNARDRKSLLEDAIDSEFESAKLSERLRRAQRASAQAGLPTGVTPYGYRRTYNATTGRLVAQELDPAEAPVIRELFERLLKGHTFRAIARDFETRGVRTRLREVVDRKTKAVKVRGGLVFSPQHLRSLAETPAYAKLRVHQGKVVGEATWPAIVDRETWYGVQRLLTEPGRRTSRPGRAKHLVSMIAKCDVCSEGLSVTVHKRLDRLEYRCQSKGHVRVAKDELETYVEGEILEYLARDDVHQALMRSDEDDDELAKIRDELAKVRAELVALRAAVGAGRLSVASLVAAEPGLLARVADLEARQREATTPPVLRGLLAPGKDVAHRWTRAEMSTRREVARLLLVSEVLGEVHVVPRPVGRRNTYVPVEERVAWYRVD